MRPAPWPPWVICHLPADSSAIPVDARAWLRLSETELRTELALRTAHRSRDLFAPHLPDHQVVRAPFSPLIIDLCTPAANHRHALPEASFLAGSASGSGLLSTSKPLSPAALEALADEYYHPHQAWFAARVALKVAAHGRCLVVNASSFPSQDAAFDVDESLAPLPEIRLGAHPAHTPRRLLDTFEAAFLGYAWQVRTAPGHPAAMVPRLQEGLDSRVHCLSVELNRALYWNETTGQPNDQYEACRERLAATLGAAFSRLG